MNYEKKKFQTGVNSDQYKQNYTLIFGKIKTTKEKSGNDDKLKQLSKSTTGE